MKDPIFKANPQVECYFETSDGQKFYKDFDAKTHSKSLESKKIKKVINPDFSTEVAEVEEVIADSDVAKANASDVVFEEVTADAQKDADAKAKADADAKTKKDADAKAKADADAKAKSDAKANESNQAAK